MENSSGRLLGMEWKTHLTSPDPLPGPPPLPNLLDPIQSSGRGQCSPREGRRAIIDLGSLNEPRVSFKPRDSILGERAAGAGNPLRSHWVWDSLPHPAGQSPAARISHGSHARADPGGSSGFHRDTLGFGGWFSPASLAALQHPEGILLLPGLKSRGIPEGSLARTHS